MVVMIIVFIIEPKIETNLIISLKLRISITIIFLLQNTSNSRILLTNFLVNTSFLTELFLKWINI
jgi:hypothetical protein